MSPFDRILVNDFALGIHGYKLSQVVVALEGTEAVKLETLSKSQNERRAVEGEQ